MSVQAKFFVQQPEVHSNSDAVTVKMGAVCRGIENAEWAQATPSGTIQMTVLNTVAAEQLIPGEEYLVTFTHCPKPKPGDGHQPSPVRNKQGYSVCSFCGMYLSKTDGWDAEKGVTKIIDSDEAYEAHRAMYNADAPVD